MRPPNLPRYLALLPLTLCLSGADCGGGETPDPGLVDSGSAFECSNIGREDVQTSGRFEVGVGGAPVSPWRVGISPVRQLHGGYDIYLQGCVRGGGAELWRFSSVSLVSGPVKGAPVTLPVPTRTAPGFTGGVLDVKGNREHHFLLKGAGTLVVHEFDPDARRFVARGEVYPEQGGTVTLSWDLTW